MKPFAGTLMDELISGVNSGIWLRQWAIVRAADYVGKGILTLEQAQRIADETAPVSETEPAVEPEVE